MLLNLLVEALPALSSEAQLFCIVCLFLLAGSTLLIISFTPRGGRRLGSFVRQLMELSQASGLPKPQCAQRRSKTHARKEDQYRVRGRK